MRSLGGSKLLDILIGVLGISMVLYHLIYTRTLFQGPIEHQNTHLIFGLLLVFLGGFKKSTKLWPLTLLLILLSLVSTIYIHVFYQDLEGRMGLPTTMDVIIGILLLAVCFEATRRAFGWAMPIVGLFFIAYTFLGQYLPRPFWHFPIPLKMAISSYNIGFSGMYGMALGMSANYIFLFIVFGAFLKVSGATEFFNQLSALVGRWFSGGAGMSAVISSALVGMVTGQGSTVCAITGPFTIPLMKKVGYTGLQAAAIEAVAATGGNIMPPVMGISAFLMAEYTGVPYIKICAMAIIPSILYYFCLAMYVQLSASKNKVARMYEKVDYTVMTKAAPLFFIPLITLVVLLALGYSLMFVSFVIPIVVILLSLIRKETRGSLRKWADACISGATTGASLAVVTAVIGVIISGFDLTGLGVVMPGIIEQLSGGIPIIVLLLAGLVTVILGAALPVYASYLTAAMLIGPVLTKIGIPLISAHFFLFLFSVFALISPPEAMSVLVAASIARVRFMTACIESMKAGLICLFLPFLVIWVPGIILQPQDPVEMVIKITICVVEIFFSQVLFTSYYLTDLNRGEKCITLLSVLAMAVYLVTGSYIGLALGLVTGILVTYWELKKRKKVRVAAALG